MLLIIHFINGSKLEQSDVINIAVDKTQIRIETKDEVWFFNLSEIDRYSIINEKEL
jgi:hypothetical protein